MDKQPTIGGLFKLFLMLGLTAFGGPAMVTYIKDLSVNRYKWLDDETFKNGVALCQSIPGATAMQMAAYVGLKIRGIPGALAAYTGFGLPAFVLMLMLSIFYIKYHDISMVLSVFSGLQVIVVAIVANSIYSFGKGIIKNYKDFFIAALAVILFWMGISPFMVIFLAAITGFVFFKNQEIRHFPVPQTNLYRIYLWQTVLLLSVPITGLLILYFIDAKLFRLAILMLKIDLFAFGGGFASLPLMLHEIVNVRAWMDYRTFMNGIALGQVTPGPIVITATFVGYLLYGLKGALTATIAIFTPSFLILVTTTPFFDRFRSSQYFQGIIRGILASFVGLLFFVTIKFGTAVKWDIIRVVLLTASFAL